MAGPPPSRIRPNRMTAPLRSGAAFAVLHPGAAVHSGQPRNSKSETRSCKPERRWTAIMLSGLLLLSNVMSSRAALQFDVFLGYDGVIPEATWFPVVCEIKNDGPSFNGVIELNGGSLNQGQLQKVEVELPTGTLKRLVIPVFSTTRVFNTSWDVRLLDERGKVRSEQPGLRANKNVASRTPLIGALARTPGGAPVIRPIAPQNSELQPTSARLQPSIFPDNALVLEGLQALYLNSEKAAELKDNQVRALLAWLNAGGHLIVAIEQINDVTASSWLKNLLPCDVKSIQPVPRHTEIQQWLQNATWATNLSANSQQLARRYGLPGPNSGGNQRNRSMPAQNRPTQETGVSADKPFSNLPDDFGFEGAELQVATGTLRDARIVVAADS